jgi:hypothetical protein
VLHLREPFALLADELQRIIEREAFAGLDFIATNWPHAAFSLPACAPEALGKAAMPPNISVLQR